MNDMNRMSDITPAARHGGDMREKQAADMAARDRMHHGKGSLRMLSVLVAALVVVQALSAMSVFSGPSFPAVNPNGWQAVFMANQNVPLFGHLSEAGRDYVKLTDVYYTQVSQQATSSKQAPQISLVKFGAELYGPMDEMNIPKSQILHWEEMRSDSTVVKSIEQALVASAAADATKAQTQAQVQK